MTGTRIVDAASLRPKAREAIAMTLGADAKLGRCILIPLGATSAMVICETNYGLVRVHDRAVLKSSVTGVFLDGGSVKVTEYHHAYGVTTFDITSAVWPADIVVGSAEEADEVLRILGPPRLKNARPVPPLFPGPARPNSQPVPLVVECSKAASELISHLASLPEVLSVLYPMGHAVGGLALEPLRSATNSVHANAVALVDELHSVLWNAVAADRISVDDILGVLVAGPESIEDVSVSHLDVGLNTAAFQAFLGAMPGGGEQVGPLGSLWRDEHNDMVDDFAAWSATAVVRLADAGFFTILQRV